MRRFGLDTGRPIREMQKLHHSPRELAVGAHLQIQSQCAKKGDGGHSVVWPGDLDMGADRSARCFASPACLLCEWQARCAAMRGEAYGGSSRDESMTCGKRRLSHASIHAGGSGFAIRAARCSNQLSSAWRPVCGVEPNGRDPRQKALPISPCIRRIPSRRPGLDRLP